MKSYLRGSKASGTDRAKVALLLRRGWEPGLAIGKALSRRKRRQAWVAQVGGQHHD
jgi:hypothetical protein